MIPSEFREFHFANDDWFNPRAPPHFGGGQSRVKAAPGRRQVNKWAVFDRDLVQFNGKGFQKLFAETSAHPTSKFELPIVIDADQQGAPYASFRRRVGCSRRSEKNLVGKA